MQALFIKKFPMLVHNICCPYYLRCVFVASRFFSLSIRCTVAYNVVMGCAAFVAMLWSATAFRANFEEEQLSYNADLVCLIVFAVHVIISLPSISVVWLDLFGLAAALTSHLLRTNLTTFKASLDHTAAAIPIIEALIKVCGHVALVMSVEFLLLCRASETTFQLSALLRANKANKALNAKKETTKADTLSLFGAQSIETMDGLRGMQAYDLRRLRVSQRDQNLPVLTTTAVGRTAVITIFRSLVFTFAIIPQLLTILGEWKGLSARAASVVHALVAVLVCVVVCWRVIQHQFRRLLSAPLQQIAGMIEALTSPATLQGSGVGKRRNSLTFVNYSAPLTMDSEDPISKLYVSAETQARLPLCFQPKTVSEPTAEAELIRRYTRKLWRLVQLGLGDAGQSVVTKYLQRSAMYSKTHLGFGIVADAQHVQPATRTLLRGEKIHAIFMFCDIKSFTDITEKLQEDVLTFVNEIAAIVHSEVDAACGAPNKNIGDAFLLTWKLPDAPLVNIVKSRRRSGMSANSPFSVSPEPHSPMRKAPMSQKGSRSSLTTWLADSSRAIDFLMSPEPPTPNAGWSNLSHIRKVRSKSNPTVERPGGRNSLPELSPRLLKEQSVDVSNVRRGSDTSMPRKASADAESSLQSPSWLLIRPSSVEGDLPELSVGPSALTSLRAPLQAGRQTSMPEMGGATSPLRRRFQVSLPGQISEEQVQSDGTQACIHHAIEAETTSAVNTEMGGDKLGVMPSFQPKLLVGESSGRSVGGSALRRSSSRFFVTSHSEGNPYRQRRGIQIYANNALASALNMLTRLNLANTPDGRLAYYQKRTSHPGGFQLGFGLHIGYAVEGPIGSHLKVDASYLSPAVNITARLESATRVYGVDLIVSQKFAECLSERAQNLLRTIDRVRLKGVGDPLMLYTFDWDCQAAIGRCHSHTAMPGTPVGEPSLATSSNVSNRNQWTMEGDQYSTDDSIIDIMGVHDDTKDAHQPGDTRRRAYSSAPGVGMAVEGLEGKGGFQTPAIRAPIRYIKLAPGEDVNSPGSSECLEFRFDDTVTDMAALQPTEAFDPLFFEHAEAAVMHYLGGSDYSLDWNLARQHAKQALKLRPRDGPLLNMLAYMDSVGEGDDRIAPLTWPGFRSLEAK